MNTKRNAASASGRGNGRERAEPARATTEITLHSWMRERLLASIGIGVARTPVEGIGPRLVVRDDHVVRPYRALCADGEKPIAA